MGTDAGGCGAAKEAVRAVLKDVIASNPALREVRGVAFYDTQKDAIIQASSSHFRKEITPQLFKLCFIVLNSKCKFEVLIN